MRLIAILILGLTVVAASAGTSKAEDGCGRGYYWNGYRCAPFRYEPRHRYEERRRHEWRRDWRRHYDPPPPPRYYNHRSRYHRPDHRRWHTWNGCPSHYTVQDGLCKPYRGY